jgi:hypothetical protein
MTEQEKKTPVNAPACACGRGDLWMEMNQQPLQVDADQQPPEADADDQPKPRQERPGPQSRDMAVTAGPVMSEVERN